MSLHGVACGESSSSTILRRILLLMDCSTIPELLAALVFEDTAVVFESTAVFALMCHCLLVLPVVNHHRQRFYADFCC